MQKLSLVRRISRMTTLLQSRFCAVEVGRDAEGNIYYREKKRTKGLRERRWVYYVGEAEASNIPPEWHIWLHHMADAPLTNVPRKAWQKPHVPNLTGTPDAYFPPGHTLVGGERAKATGDYQAWKPE